MLGTASTVQGTGQPKRGTAQLELMVRLMRRGVGERNGAVNALDTDGTEGVEKGDGNSGLVLDGSGNCAAGVLDAVTCSSCVFDDGPTVATRKGDGNGAVDGTLLACWLLRAHPPVQKLSSALLS